MNIANSLRSLRAFGPLWILLLILGPVLFFPPGSAQAAEGSLFDEDLQWNDEQGAPFLLSSLRGTRVILTLAYTNCSTACPLTIGRLHRIDNLLKERGVSAQIVVVSLDPQRDTPTARSHFRQMHKLPENWHIIGGSSTDVRTLSVMLNYSYRADPATGEIIHSNKIIALNPDGTIAVSVEGLDSDVESFVTTLVKK